MKMKERKKILTDPFSLTFSKSQSTIFSVKSLPFFFFSQISSNFPRFSSNQNKHRRAFHKPKASIFFFFFVCVITNYILYLFSFELTLAKRKKKKTNSLAKATKNRGKKQQIFIKKTLKQHKGPAQKVSCSLVTGDYWQYNKSCLYSITDHPTSLRVHESRLRE